MSRSTSTPVFTLVLPVAVRPAVGPSGVWCMGESVGGGQTGTAGLLTASPLSRFRRPSAR